jgi:probable phosphoglycerate mutase
LTAKGEAQATHLREEVKKIPSAEVFCSPKKRALETCGALKHKIDPDLCEWDYGDFEGKTSAEIHQTNPHWNVFENGCPHGESPEQISARADRFLKKIRDLPGNIVVFSHGHFLRVLAARFLGLGPDLGRHLLLSVASISILGFDRKEPVIILWNSKKME